MRHASRQPVLFLIVLLAGCRIAADEDAAARTARARPEPTGTHALMLGTGTPNADPDRSGPAVAVIAGGHAYLVDAGPGIVRRAAAAQRAGEAALAQPDLDILFLTHLHSDHTAGLSDLMLTPWVLDRARPLRVYGPPGTKAMLDHLQAAYSEDIRMRTEGLEQANDQGYRVEVHEIEVGTVYEDDNVKVIAFAVPHGSWRYAFGYRFEASDRTIVVSGDTGPSDVFDSACNGCDVLIHEVYSSRRFLTRPARWQSYHSSFHTSTDELAAIATRARPALLVLYHQLYWGATDADLIAELRSAGYAGDVVSAHDLGVY
jgi:ribonuclease BN (tRNA processing enzyme)